jgi:hypothetical protein
MTHDFYRACTAGFPTSWPPLPAHATPRSATPSTQVKPTKMLARHIVILQVMLLNSASSLIVTPCRSLLPLRSKTRVVLMEDAEQPSNTGQSSLEEKMAGWEASEEEQRASTLGGNLPLVGMPGMPGRMTRSDQPDKVDGFDVGMNISAIILFPLALLLLSAPIWLGSIDVSSVGPPPTS